MFKQIFNRPNQIILSSNFKFMKQISKSFFFTNSLIRSNSYLIRNRFDKSIIKNQLFSKLQVGSNVLKRHMLERRHFQSTIVSQQQPLSLETRIEQNEETLFEGQKQFKMNNDNVSNFITNESSKLLNEKEILGETDKDTLERNALGNNQQVLENSTSFSNLDNKDTRKVDDFSANIDISTSNIKEESRCPVIETKERDINDIWNDYNNLTREQFKMLKLSDFNNIIGEFNKYLKNSDVPDKSTVCSKILSIFEDLEKKAKLEPNVLTYNMFMSTALGLGDLSNLCYLFRAMKNQGIKPNKISYNIVMSGFVKLGVPQNAFALFKEMVDAGIKGNKITYTILLSACAKKGHYVGALEYYKMMTEEGIEPDVQIYNTLLNVLTYSADRDQLIRIYEGMKAQGIKPTVLTYSSLIRAMNIRGEKEYVEKFYNEMVSDGIKPNVLILEELGITGLEAIQKFQDPSGKSFNLLDYNTLLHGCLKKSEYNDAFKIFSMMQENKVNPSLATYTIIIGAYFKINEAEKAIELFNKMKNDNIVPDSQIYTLMIGFLLNQRKVNEAFNLLSEVTNLDNEKDNGIIFKPKEVNRLLDSASTLEDGEVTEKLFHKISAIKSQISSGAFEKIFRHVAKDDDYEEKIRYYLKHMEKNGIPIKNTTYGSIIEGFIQRNDSKNSINWYKYMIEDGLIPTGQIIFKMMQFFSKNKKDSVIKYWSDFYHHGIRPEKQDYNFIIDYCCKSGQDNLVSKIFSQCRAMGFVPTNGNLLKIMQFYSKKRKVAKVIEYWDYFYILGIKPRLEDISFMVDFCCTLDNKKLISRILGQCKEAGYDAYSLYRLKQSNSGVDEINSLLLETTNTNDNSSMTTSSYEKDLELIEHWINSREKDYNSLLSNNKKLNLSEINRLRRILNIEERSLKGRERLDRFIQMSKSRLNPGAQKSLQSWTPYKKPKQTQETQETQDLPSNSKEVNEEELLIDSIIETTFQNVTEQREIKS